MSAHFDESFTPTGSNKQQVHWTVFEDTTKLQESSFLVIDWVKLMVKQIPDEITVKRMQRLVLSWENGEDRILHGAPHLIMAHSQANLPSAPSDCVIALTCWAGYLTSAANTYAPLTKALGLPAGHKCFGAVMLGYPQYGYFRIPNRNAPLVTWR